MSKKYFFSTNQKKILQLQKWNETYLAVILGYETTIWHHQSQNLGFFQVLIRAHCVLVSSILPKTERKNEKNLSSSTMIPQVELFLFVFWKNWGYQSLFEINWPLISSNGFKCLPWRGYEIYVTVKPDKFEWRWHWKRNLR